jgi:hypothetical protein
MNIFFQLVFILCKALSLLINLMKNSFTGLIELCHAYINIEISRATTDFRVSSLNAHIFVPHNISSSVQLASGFRILYDKWPT